MSREVKLESGARLKIQAAPFAQSKALYQAMLREMQKVSVSSKQELGELFKNLMCLGYASPEIDACLEVCLSRCAYKPADCSTDFLKIDQDTFEPVERRVDYLRVCTEVAQENVAPFVKDLYARWSVLLEAMTPKTPK